MSIKPKSHLLVVTRTKDVTADHVLGRMAERNIPYLRLNSDSFGEAHITLRFPDVHESVISIDSARLAMSEIGGVWLRRIAKPKMSQIHDPEARTFAESELDFTLRWLIDLLGNYCPVLDGEVNVLEGRNKFDQLAIAEMFGFCIPETLVTNDPSAARDFVGRYKLVAIKSVAGYGQKADDGFYTVYTNIVTKDILDRFESIRMAPVCLQEYIDKAFELRITVVGRQMFGCRIDSQNTERTQTDWRRRDRATPYSVYNVDCKLGDQLNAIMEHYGVRFASFDLIVTPDGRIVFLEMNPATQFLWIEDLTGMPITDAIINELLVQYQR